MTGHQAARLTRFFLSRRWLLKLLTRGHILIYRLSGGAIGGLAMGVPTLLLTTVGRKSGRRFTTPVYFLTEGSAFAVVASYGGSPTDPAWFKNLQHADGEIEVGPVRMRVHAEVASPEIKARLWPAFARLYPAYDVYQSYTERPIPVVLLHPIG